MDTPRDLPETPRHQIPSYNETPAAPKPKRKSRSTFPKLIPIDITNAAKVINKAKVISQLTHFFVIVFIFYII